MTVPDHLNTVRERVEWLRSDSVYRDDQEVQEAASVTQAALDAIEAAWDNYAGLGETLESLTAEVGRLRAELAAMEKERDEWIGHAATSAHVKDELAAELAAAREAVELAVANIPQNVWVQIGGKDRARLAAATRGVPTHDPGCPAAPPLAGGGPTIEILLAAARELLNEATRLASDPNLSWHISQVTKAPRPPLVLESEYERVSR